MSVDANFEILSPLTTANYTLLRQRVTETSVPDWFC